MIFASRETELIAKASKAKNVQVYSFFPVDRADCPCQKMIGEWKRKMALENEEGRKRLLETTPFLTCPKDKTNMQRYEIVCTNCNDVQGYCYALNDNLDGWCDFHYVQWTKGDYWRGCLTPHISPVTQKLLFECCCGNDTRDFRPNMTLSKTQADKLEKSAMQGRELNQRNSKFVTRKVAKKVIT